MTGSIWTDLCFCAQGEFLHVKLGQKHKRRRYPQSGARLAWVVVAVCTEKKTALIWTDLAYPRHYGIIHQGLSQTPLTSIPLSRF